MNIKKLKQVAIELLHRSSKHDREMVVDRHLFIRLDAKHSHVTRQHYIEFAKSERPSRIDFRIGGTNPVLVELAVRPAGGSSQLYGSQNRSELGKLTRIPQSQARLRAMLLMDLAARPILKSRLKPTYDCVSAGPGRFQRSSVRVLYVHAELQYDFLWRPSAY